jgi:phosphatidylinositol alpha-1,6-mannosyltransferase
MNKIIIVSSEFPPLPGGIGNHAYGLFRAFTKLGFDVSVLTNSRHPESENLWVNANLIRHKVKFLPRRKVEFLTYLMRVVEFFKLIKEANSKNEESWFIYSGKFSVWLLGLWVFNNRTKSCVVIHGTELLQIGFAKRLFQKSLNKADLVVSVSNFTKTRLHEHYMVPHSKSFVINNGYLPKQNSLIKVIEFSERGNEKLNLITVGNLTERKGQINVIEAIPNIKKFIPCVNYTMVGIPTELKFINPTIQELKLEKEINIVGAVEDDEKWYLLGQADIFMMLSQELKNGDFEGFGIAILEANSIGVPAIGSRNSGISDAIRDGFSGVLVDPCDKIEIANAVLTIMANYPFFSNEAKKHALTFQWDQKILEYINVFSKVNDRVDT